MAAVPLCASRVRRAAAAALVTGCGWCLRRTPTIFPRLASARWFSSMAKRKVCARTRFCSSARPASFTKRCWLPRSRAAGLRWMLAVCRALLSRRARPCVRALCWQTALVMRKRRSTSTRATTCPRSSARGATCRRPGPACGGDVCDVSRRASAWGRHGLTRCVMPSLDGLSDGHFDVCLHGAHDRDVVRTACVSVYGLSTSGGSRRDRW